MSYEACLPQDLLGPLNEVEHTFAPATLYVAGDTSLLRQGARVAIVGSRKASPEGLARARKLAARLCACGIVVVSGLAEGIDTAAHQATLEAGGRTVAVLGTPLDQVYPKRNAALQHQLMREHLCVSQFSVGSPVHRRNFPLRNRTMALLADATVIIEATDTSGALGQGWEALRLGRGLFIAKACTEDHSVSWPQTMFHLAAGCLSPRHAQKTTVCRGLKQCFTTAVACSLMRPSRRCLISSLTGQKRTGVVALPSELVFASLLQYAPRGTTPLSQLSRTVTYAVKSDGFIGATRVIAHAARRVAALLETSPFLQAYFGPGVTLVPMPRSSPRRAGFLWPAERICESLLAEGLGRDILRCLARTRPVQPASRAATDQRPTPPDHDDAIAVRFPRRRTDPAQITLVDDVITRGSSCIGVVPRLHEAYPDATVRYFALVRTISPGEVSAMLAPTQGTITYREGRLRRQP